MASVITGTGMHVPADIVTNSELEQFMSTDDEWIRSRTGVEQRHISAEGEPTSAHAIKAGAAALGDAGIAPENVDALVVATMTPDQYAPGSVPMVQAGLGLDRIQSYGIRQQCSGFLYGLDLGDALIKSDKADTVLVIGAEAHANIQPWIEAWRRVRAGGHAVTDTERERHDRHRHWAVLFGDGAGAAVLQRRDTDSGMLGARLFTDGALYELILAPRFGSRWPTFADADSVAADEHMPTMQGPMLFRNAVRAMPEAVTELLDKHGLEIADVDLVIAHQANERITDGVRKRLGLDDHVVPSNIARYGNTTAGTLPILYHEMRAAGRVTPGTLVCFVAFGAGAHWGAALYREPPGPG